MCGDPRAANRPITQSLCAGFTRYEPAAGDMYFAIVDKLDMRAA